MKITIKDTEATFAALLPGDVFRSEMGVTYVKAHGGVSMALSSQKHIRQFDTVSFPPTSQATYLGRMVIEE